MDHRTERISEALREELSELIGYEMSDPRIGSAVVTDVHISPDKRHALIRVGVQSEQAVLALETAKGFLRRELGKRLQMYRIPELHFEADALAEAGDRMGHLLKRIKKGRPRDAPGPPEKKAVE
ncbi:MAG: 30S ribosome-binding factor RbfA [Bryobacteraceae bacterium]